ncbi:MAG: Gfo/Idh/MocA family oxidoreductase [Balneolaceae bacterium]
MQQETFGIGIVGCGTISDTHAKAIRQSEAGVLLAACSRDKSRVDNFCSRHGGVPYSDYDSFLAHDGLDVVVICTPSGTHLEMGLAAADQGKHLIVEKPIEITLERGRQLVEYCNRAGVQLAVIYQNRFIPDVQQMKQALDLGEIGRAFMVDGAVKWFRDQEYYDRGGWRGTLDLDGGGAVINQSIHTIDLMVWMCGDVESLHAYTGTYTHANVEGEDNAVVSMKFADGSLGLFRASTSMVPPQERTIEIHGTEGTARLSGDRFSIIREDDAENSSAGSSGSGAASPLSGMSGDHHAMQYRSILESFRSGTVPELSGEESLRSLAVVEAIYQSSRLRQRIDVPKRIYS